MTQNHSSISLLTIVLFVLSVPIFGQQYNLYNLPTTNQTKAEEIPNFLANPAPKFVESASINARNNAAFPNPILLNLNQGCQSENLHTERFDEQLSINQRMAFCEVLQEVAVKLSGNWSPALSSEIQQIWQVFIRENVKIRPMKADASPRMLAAAEAFTENGTNQGFNASFYLRPERAKDKSFFLIFMHELRHVFDFYMLWKNQSNITEAELEKRAFRIMGKISQETPDKENFRRIATFWKDKWKNLPQNEIDRKREQKIEKFMRSNGLYKRLLKTPEKYLVEFSSNQAAAKKATLNQTKETDEEKLPYRVKIQQSENKIPQQVKELSFTTEKAANLKSPDEILKAAVINEKNLYRKMDNFVYDQDLQLQCWKKQKVIESYGLSRSVARTQNGETLFQNENISSSSSKSPNLPTCVLNFNSIKTDADETFWSAPYLDQMPVKFDHFTVINGIPVARYTVYEPSMEKFNQIAAAYPHIKPFRAFVGTLWVSVEDSQIIRFAGTSFPEAEITGYQSSKPCASYGATAVRQKLASGIWVTTLLNIVAVTDKKGKLKPFSYTVKYQNYRQGTSDVKILDDEQTASR